MPLFSFLPLLLFGRQGDGVYNLYLLDKKKLRFGSPMSLSIYSASKKKISTHLVYEMIGKFKPKLSPV